MPPPICDPGDRATRYARETTAAVATADRFRSRTLHRTQRLPAAAAAPTARPPEDGEWSIRTGSDRRRSETEPTASAAPRSRKVLVLDRIRDIPRGDSPDPAPAGAANREDRKADRPRHGRTEEG